MLSILHVNFWCLVKESKTKKKKTFSLKFLNTNNSISPSKLPAHVLQSYWKLYVFTDL